MSKLNQDIQSGKHCSKLKSIPIGYLSSKKIDFMSHLFIIFQERIITEVGKLNFNAVLTFNDKPFFFSYPYFL